MKPFFLFASLAMSVGVLAGPSKTVTASASSSTPLTSTSTTSTPFPTGTTLPQLVAEIPQCAFACFAAAAVAVGCPSTDLPCLCQKAATNATEVGTELATCLFLSSCATSEISVIDDVAQAICSAASTASSDQLRGASSVLASDLAVASSLSVSAASRESASAKTATATGTATTTGTGTGTATTGTSSTSTSTSGGSRPAAPLPEPGQGAFMALLVAAAMAMYTL